MPGLDPVQRVDDDSRDLQDVVYWEPRNRIDALAVRLHAALLAGGRATVVLLATLIIGAQLLLTGVAALTEPLLGAYILLSVVPALGLAVYVWRWDVTSAEPAGMLVVTFLLGFLLAGLAAVLNTSLSGLFGEAGLGLLLFFFVVVGPVEETVKWLAVRLYAYRSGEFDAVVDGAVYGAMAGLGFATIENALYITEQYVNAAGAVAPLQASLTTAATRSLAGPGHVIYSGVAGYYLGLAKFNPRRRGPIVVKGLVVATLLHATYNTLATLLLPVTEALGLVSVVGAGGVFVTFILVYDGAIGYYLYRKLRRYREAFSALDAGRVYRERGGDVVLTEFDPPRKPEESPPNGAGKD